MDLMKFYLTSIKICQKPKITCILAFYHKSNFHPVLLDQKQRVAICKSKVQPS